MQQSIVFTFLAQDCLDNGNLQAALFVAPRLTPDNNDQRAADFPAFADWPAIVAEARVVVEDGGGNQLTVSPDTTLLNSDLWQRYIAPLPVNGWVFKDFEATEIRSFPAQSIVALAQGLYHAVAAESGGDSPNPLAGGLRDLGAAYQQIRGAYPLEEPGGHEAWSAEQRAKASAALRAHIDATVDSTLRARQEQLGLTKGQLGRGGRPPATAPVSPAAAVGNGVKAALDLAEARRFYDRPEAHDPEAQKYPTPDPQYVPSTTTNDRPDFHSALGALADHPELLKRLGIIVTFEINPEFVGNGADLHVHLEHDALTGNPIALQPFTRTFVDKPFFQAVSETGDIDRAMLLLDDTNRFDVSQVDVDSTALLVEQRVANVYPIAASASDDDPVATELPTLRSSGFTVTRLARAAVLEQRIAKAADNNKRIEAGKQVTLSAEDLVRGYRIDVHDGKDWRSLMRRHMSYVDATTNTEELAVDDEGYLKSATLTQTPGGTANQPAYLHESMFGWDGWSLVVPRPGSHLPKDTPADGDPPVTDKSEAFPEGVALHPTASLVSGTLPRLRYGGAYRMRARTVDLTGRSTPYADDSHATATHTFRRFQPIAHPTVVLRHTVTEGESTLRMVIRSGVLGDPLDPAAALSADAPSSYTSALNSSTPRQFATYRAENERHLVPPKVSQLDSELLGRFDADAIGVTPAGGADYRAAYARARREQGTLQDTRVLSATDPTADTAADGIHLVPPLAHDGDFTPGELDATLAGLQRGEAPEAGFAVVHDTDALAVPYLPDYLATGIALRFAGFGTAAGWTHTEQLALTGPWPDLVPYRLVLVDGATPDVTVAGQVVTVALPPGATATVRSSSTIDAATLDLLGLWDWIDDTVPAAELPDVLAGKHQMITHRETITLVHATQRPLTRPAIADGLRAARHYGDTHTEFRGALSQQSATTSRVDVEATWREWFDDIASGQPPILVGGKTGHAFDLSIAPAADRIDLTDAGGAGRPAANPQHEFGDTIHRVVTYTPVATTRFREYLPPVLAGDHPAQTVTGPSTTIHVPNSVRPGAPRVHSVMPTFRWYDLSPDPYATPATSRRRHSGLRVWLERPWHISGEDEMLGVVVTGEDGIIRGGDLRRQHVTVWGKDPIRRTGELPAPVPRPRDFRGAALVVRDRLTLAEFGASVPGQHPGVTVVGHPVTYSPERDMWFADIDIDPGEASWPFVRLALTRFQPWSISDAELSPVTLVDFVHVLNDRTASITRPDDVTVGVSVSGIADRISAPFILPPNTIVDAQLPGNLRRGARAWVERRGPLATDLDWTRVGERIELPVIDEDEVARVWAGTIRLPESVAAALPSTDPDAGGSRYRVVVAEWESLPYDNPFGDGTAVERYVYLDRFGL